MTAPREPIRWRDDPGTGPDGAAEALRTYGERLATADERRQLQERLAPWLEASGSKSPAQVRVRWLSQVARAGLVLTVGVLTWLVAQHWLHSEQAVRPLASRTTVPGASERVAPETARMEVAPAGVVQAAEGPAARSAPSSADVPKTAVVVAKVRRRSSVPAPLMAASASTSPERELELLRKAQELLHKLPAVSEARLAEHARDYPHGVFEQEREMLRIELAFARGERVRARELAQQFMTRFAGSTYQRRLETLLAPNIAQEDRRDVDTQSTDATNN